MSSLLSDTRRAAGVAVQGCSGGALTIGAGRVILGWNSRAMTNLSIWQDVQANGPYVLLGPIRDLNMDNLGFGPASCSMKVFVNKSKETSFDSTDLDDLITSISAALTKLGNYGTIANPLSLVPRRVRLMKYDYDYEDQDGLVCLSWGIEIPDP